MLKGVVAEGVVARIACIQVWAHRACRFPTSRWPTGCQRERGRYVTGWLAGGRRLYHQRSPTQALDGATAGPADLPEEGQLPILRVQAPEIWMLLGSGGPPHTDRVFKRTQKLQ